MSSIKMLEKSTKSGGESPVEEESMAVVADRMIPFDISFGPYPGKDSALEKHNGWMQYVFGVKNMLTANLIAFYVENELYFKTMHQIQPDEELLLWVGLQSDAPTISLALSDELPIAADTTVEIPVATYPCRDCENYFSSLSAVRDHWYSIHSYQLEAPSVVGENLLQSGPECVFNFPCSKCPESFETEAELADHTSFHKITQCEHCGKIFATRGRVKLHFRFCKGRGNKKATPLNQILETAARRRKTKPNLNLQHSAEDGNYKYKYKPYFRCKECKAAFEKKSELCKHKSIHKNVSCTLCNKRFKTAGYLHSHMRFCKWTETPNIPATATGVDIDSGSIAEVSTDVDPEIRNFDPVSIPTVMTAVPNNN